ncbi:type II toxin-antitoxin system RelE/ParE family toxin [Streptomyces sp. FH025]|uniref:type II toxin-antitoxin system RelE family toxin n=1 Tax=Streptomyces sp. FH025 TaxID=2815937 RepID=UPI001A9CF97F|nr:type II toxin-antitoxin system RelE/ParE family toxin [Streptomyces sp. FH025]MBO1420016.1 type II toxin-antitoxin system RelE/ParE family toxin [Streptomyces sp. FH025]
MRHRASPSRRSWGRHWRAESEYRTVFRAEAQAELLKIPRDTALRILAKLTELERDPLGFNTTALVSQPDRRRLRVGDYRVIYTIDDGHLIVWVVHVAHRSTVYDT